MVPSLRCLVQTCVLLGPTLGPGATARAAEPLQRVYRPGPVLPLPADRPLAHPQAVFSADGRRVLALGSVAYAVPEGAASEALVIWNTATGAREVARFPAPRLPFGPTQILIGCGGDGGPRLPLTPANPALLWEEASGLIRYYGRALDTVTGLEQPKASWPEASLATALHHSTQAALCQDPPYDLRTVALDSQRVIGAWSAPTGSPLPALPPMARLVSRLHQGWLAVAMSEDGQQVAGVWQRLSNVRKPNPALLAYVGDAEQRLLVYRTGDRSPRLDLPLEALGKGPLSMAPSGARLIRFLGPRAEGWDLVTGKRLWTRDLDPALRPEKWVKDEQAILLQHPDRLVCLDAATGRVRWQADLPGSLWALGGDGESILIQSWPEPGRDLQLQVWRLDEAPAP